MAPPSFESRLCGTLGMVAAVCLFLSPVPTCRRVLKERCTQSFSAIPYLAQIVESSWWMFWALVAGNRLEVLFTNLVAIAIHLLYVGVFLVYTPRRSGGKKKLRLQCAFAAFLVSIAPMVAATVEKSDDIFGISALSFNIIKYAAPLSVARLVITTQSVEFMPLPLTLASLVCSVLWGLHGFFLEEAYIILPNAAGVAFGCLQVILYIRYGCCKAPDSTDAGTDDCTPTDADAAEMGRRPSDDRRARATGANHIAKQQNLDLEAGLPGPAAEDMSERRLASKEKVSQEIRLCSKGSRRSSKETVAALAQKVLPSDADFPIMDQGQVAVFVGRHGSKQAAVRMGSKEHAGRTDPMESQSTADSDLAEQTEETASVVTI